MSSFQPRSEYMPPQPRVNGGGNGYRRNNRHQHQQNKADQSKDKEQNGVQAQQQPQAMTNGGAADNVEEAPVEQLNQLSLNKQESAPITA